VPNLVEIRRTATEIWRFFIFQDGGRRHLEFLKFETFNGRTAQESPINCVAMPNLVKIDQTGRDMVICRVFKMAAAAVLDF